MKQHSGLRCFSLRRLTSPREGKSRMLVLDETSKITSSKILILQLRKLKARGQGASPRPHIGKQWPWSRMWAS